MSGGLAVLCSGQGAQHREMFALVGAAPEAQPVFEAALPHLDGVDPRDFVRQADEARLFTNRAGQILCCTQALAAWSALRASFPEPILVLGYSVGELAAWGCADMLDAATLMRLASIRADAMDAAAARLDCTGGALAGIVGLHRSQLDPLLAETATSLAIVNAPDSVVVGGEAAALDAFCDRARSAGATRIVRLRVAVPAHTPLLAEASRRFRTALDAASPRPPRAPLLSGIDGDLLRGLPEACDRLALQVSRTIDWSACLSHALERGITTMLELGPGRNLARMAAAASPQGEARALDDFRSLDGIRTWLNRTRE